MLILQVNLILKKLGSNLQLKSEISPKELFGILCSNQILEFSIGCVKRICYL